MNSSCINDSDYNNGSDCNNDDANISITIKNYYVVDDDDNYDVDYEAKDDTDEDKHTPAHI